MVQKGNLAKFESSNISKVIKATPTKISVNAFDINPYFMNFLSRFYSIIFFDLHGLDQKGNLAKFES